MSSRYAFRGLSTDLKKTVHGSLFSIVIINDSSQLNLASLGFAAAHKQMCYIVLSVRVVKTPHKFNEAPRNFQCVLILEALSPVIKLLGGLAGVFVLEASDRKILYYLFSQLFAG